MVYLEMPLVPFIVLLPRRRLIILVVTFKTLKNILSKWKYMMKNMETKIDNIEGKFGPIDMMDAKLNKLINLLQ